MAIIGIALLGFLLLAIIGQRGAQKLFKGVGIVIGLIALYLVVGSTLLGLTPVKVQPVPASAEIHDRPGNQNLLGETITASTCHDVYAALCGVQVTRAHGD